MDIFYYVELIVTIWARTVSHDAYHAYT